jgi:hypothetical protein
MASRGCQKDLIFQTVKCKKQKNKLFWHKQPLEFDSVDNFALEKVWLK